MQVLSATPAATSDTLTAIIDSGYFTLTKTELSNIGWTTILYPTATLSSISKYYD